MKEKLNEELNKKLCLYISKDLDAKISWCAIIVCWVEIYKKAERQFEKYHKSLLSKKYIIIEDFIRVVNG